MESSSRQLTNCTVVGGDKLPADAGGPAQLCAAIERAAATGAPHARFSVEVRVLSESSLSATLTTADGRILPEQRFATSDRNLTRSSLERFAKALIGEVTRDLAR